MHKYTHTYIGLIDLKIMDIYQNNLPKVNMAMTEMCISNLEKHRLT